MEEINNLISNKLWNQALDLLKEKLEANLDIPEKIKILNTMGFVNYQLGQYETALEICQSVLELDPKHAYGHKAMGTILAKIGKTTEGIKHLLTSIKLAPSFFDAYHDLALILIKNKRHAEAKKWAQRAYQLDPIRGEKLVKNFY
ncbi:MAG: tetratricopeptide repeat protein [Deltaproteobacteria bacterium]|jgi:tetratricopeptide (TPR) repeat protein|nr:tetratricopeptide repeat protein [Deltaproteobacteria bacterium]